MRSRRPEDRAASGLDAAPLETLPVGRRPQIPGPVRPGPAGQGRPRADRSAMEVRLFGPLPTRRAERGALGLLLFLSAALGLVLLHAAASTISRISQWPAAAAWTAFVLLFVFQAVVVAFLLHFWWGFARLQPGGRQILRGALRRTGGAENRLELERAARAHLQAVFATPYLESFGRIRPVLESWGEPAERVRSLEAHLLRLASSDTDPHGEWIRDFQTTIQADLDGVAERRSRWVAARAGAATAISPFGWLDALIALGHSVRLTGDIAKLYRRRATPTQCVRILLHVVLQTYVAAGTSDALESVTEQAMEGIRQTIIKTLASHVMRRAGEGLVNGLFVYRLGLRVNRYLAPIRN